MRRIFTTVFCLAVVAVLSFGCTKNDYGGTGITWEELVGRYPGMSNFPKYNGDIGEPQYVNSMGAEGVSFVDYKCEETMVSGYYDKLIGAGFKKSNGVYIKSVGGKVCVFIGTYAGGDFVLAFSWASYN